MQSIIKGQLSAAVANAGTFTASYPAGKTPGHFNKAMGHKLILQAGNVLTYPKDFSITLNALASGITITNQTSSTWPAQADYVLEMQELGAQQVASAGYGIIPGVTKAELLHINLGSPAAASANLLFTSAAITLLAGATPIASAKVLDAPRTLVGAWTNTAVMTVTGKDQYGKAMKESSASGTTYTGKKAFAVVDSIAVSADVTAATVGTGALLGLPVALPAAGYIIKELLNGAVATAATTVVADVTAAGSTATTGDVRGTMSPNSAPDGARAYSVILLADPDNRGMAQFAG